MVKVPGVPLHPPAVGVMVIVAATLALPVLIALNEAILPLPLATRPMEVVLFVQLNTVFGTAKVEAKSIDPVAEPLQTVMDETAFTVGFGFTVIVNVIGVPGHPFAVGVTVMSPEIAPLVALVVVKAGIVAVFPEAAKPIAELLFVQAYVVLGELLPNVTSVELDPEQIV
jgi:hypothetical protein